MTEDISPLKEKKNMKKVSEKYVKKKYDQLTTLQALKIEPFRKTDY